MILLALLLTAAPVRVGSKQFTESVVLGEIVRQALVRENVAALHRKELGGTRVLFDALAAGQIDVYPEYTGTLQEELARGAPVDAFLRERGLRMSGPLGFEDTYAIGVRRKFAERLGLRTLSELAAHPEARLGLSNEFLQRKDGWPRLRAVYGLSGKNVRGLQHDLAYRALQDGAVDATDLYSTDAEIRALDLVVLEDDRRAFPDYRAVLLYRADLAAPAALALRHLEGQIDAAAMIALNARARIDRVPEERAAAEFLDARRGAQGAAGSGTAAANPTPAAAGSAAADEGLASRVLRRTGEHLFLVAISLLSAILFAVPLGVLAARRRRVAQVVLGAVGLVQTVPSLALLVFMIPLLGIGEWPAIAALFLYGLLPIVRSTHAGLVGIPPELRESAEALGLPDAARLRLVELPLASRSILSGIQTAAVIDVGTATLGALIGAGGYGQPILTGIRLADTRIILEGAIPAALLALLVQALFELLERLLVPKGLQKR